MTKINKSIWHKSDERADSSKQIIALIDNVWYFGYYACDEYGNEFLIGQAHWFDVDKWCYLDDLLAQSAESESLKSENERLKKALEIGRAAYKNIVSINYITSNMPDLRQEFMEDYDKSITAALEPKGN